MHEQVVIRERLLHRVSSNSTALTKNFTINHPRYSSASYKTDELISQVYTFSWRADILGDPIQYIMTPGDGQKLYFKEEAKINEMAIGQNLFPITLDLKNTPESHLNKGKRHT